MMWSWRVSPRGPGASTLPMVVFSATRLGVTPEIYALATMIVALVATGLLGVVFWPDRDACANDLTEFRRNSMAERTVGETYNGVSQLLHWLIVVLLVVQFAIAWTMPDVTRDTKPVDLIAWHLSVGAFILLVMLIRLGWRVDEYRASAAGRPVAAVAAAVARHAFPAICDPDRAAVSGLDQRQFARLDGAAVRRHSAAGVGAVRIRVGS